MFMSSPLDNARKLVALAQSGLHFSKDPYDRERYEEVARLAASMLAAESSADISPEAILELWRKDKGYVTPKIEVRGAVFRKQEGRDCVLLVRETIDGRWTLPGGWADVNEGPRQAIEKEIVQESGYTARAVKLAAVYDKLQHAHLHLRDHGRGTAPEHRDERRRFFPARCVAGIVVTANGTGADRKNAHPSSRPDIADRIRLKLTCGPSPIHP
jgi:ADP-ribose pyrophosphatase YjhB (NUDIX family)